MTEMVAAAPAVRQKVRIVLSHDACRAGADKEYPNGWEGEIVAETAAGRIDAVVRERLTFVRLGRHFKGRDFNGNPEQKTEEIKGVGIGMYIPNWLLAPVAEQLAN